jgi:proteasome lid subunit RPN8/RPN11|tara:strand:+ start:418 stop:867 length:450 start_codon:yes stop_codon:yes gene_type:complete
MLSINMCRVLWKVNNIILTDSQEEKLNDISRDAHPNEGCAFLLGHIKKDTLEISDILQTENMDKSRVTFHIDPKTVFETYERADRENKTIGIFHSHSAPPRPSSVDIQYMEVNPVVWLIISTTTNSLAAYQLINDQLRTIKILSKKDNM